jgi:ribosome-associated heat shock protein Hsp15
MARHQQQHEEEDDAEPVRLDKWLWAARFFKTRGLAVEAIEGGKIEVNGDKPKRAKPIKVGDELRIRLGPYLHHVFVRDLSGRRGPAETARTLYEETAESIEARELHATRLKMAPPAFSYEKGRPSKKDRRDLRRLRGSDD